MQSAAMGSDDIDEYMSDTELECSPKLPELDDPNNSMMAALRTCSFPRNFLRISFFLSLAFSVIPQKGSELAEALRGSLVWSTHILM